MDHCLTHSLSWSHSFPLARLWPPLDWEAGHTLIRQLSRSSCRTGGSLLHEESREKNLCRKQCFHYPKAMYALSNCFQRIHGGGFEDIVSGEFGEYMMLEGSRYIFDLNGCPRLNSGLESLLSAGASEYVLSPCCVSRILTKTLLRSFKLKQSRAQRSTNSPPVRSSPLEPPHLLRPLA